MEQRWVNLLFGSIAALSAGTNYVFSAYGPQLALRLRLSSTSINIVSGAGNAGVYLSGPLVGVFVDRRGPRSVLLFAGLVLFIGYFGLFAMYQGGEEGLYEQFGLGGLAFCQMLTGVGGSAALAAAVKAVSQSFSKAKRGAAMATVLSCFGLSAFFYSSLSHADLISTADPTTGFLLLLSLGCSASMLLGAAFVHPPAYQPEATFDASRGQYLAVDTAEQYLGPSDDLASTPYSSRSQSPLDHDASEFSLHSDIAIRPSEAVPVRLGAGRRTRSTGPLMRDRGKEERHGAGDLDVSGWALLRQSDFWMLFCYLGLCSGVGLMMINNLGTVTITLADEDADSRAVGRAQAHLVSLLSVCNCLGRLAVGLASDFFLHHAPAEARFARVWWLVVTATLFVGSQLLAGRAETVEGFRGLALPTALTGFAYGNLFGSVIVVGLERFGLKNYATNNGFLTLSPSIFANFTNLVFGICYDRLVSPPSPTTPSSPPSSFTGSVATVATRLAKRAGREDGICRLGPECFSTAFRTTTLMSLAAVGLGVMLSLRNSFKPTYHT
ncbi:hypothetical protein JCM5296_003992 [Sporobolomyces johnsonii]